MQSVRTYMYLGLILIIHVDAGINHSNMHTGAVHKVRHASNVGNCTLLWPNFDSLPCHALSHIPGPPTKHGGVRDVWRTVTQIGPPDV